MLADERSYRDLRITCRDGYPLAATLFEPAEGRGCTLVIGSALGVPRYVYFKFASFLADRGYGVLTFDYRGIHESRGGEIPGSDMKMEQWGTLDIEAALAWMEEYRPGARRAYVGHSCGGQLAGLAPSASNLNALVFVASQSGYWKHWDWPYRWGVWFTWQSLSLLAPWFDYIPARLMGISSVNLPGGVARQWAAWGKAPRYLFDPAFGFETSRYRELALPLLSYAVEDDPFFAPPRAVDALLGEYPSARIERREVVPGELGLDRVGHFGFFKEKCRDRLWTATADWLDRQLEG